MYGIKTWGGAQLTSISKIQKLQDRMSKLTLNHRHKNLSASQRQHLLGWLTVKQEIISASHKMTFKVVNFKIPEEISPLMPLNENSLCLKGTNKLAAKPAWLAMSKAAKASFRGRAYTFNTLPHEITKEVKYSKFKEKIRNYYLNKYGE